MTEPRELGKPMEADAERREDKRMTLRGHENALVAMVDDDPLVIELTQAFLEDAGYRRFASTSDSTAAISMLLREHPDVVLLDINMPKVTGLDVLASMRNNPLLMDLPAIVLTSADDAETKLRALDLGASDFLRKPVDPSELALRLRNTLAAKAHFDALHKAFVRYVSPHLVDRIMDEGAPMGSRAKRGEVVVLFADLRGFTRMTESVGVEQVVNMLNHYFTVLSDAAYHYEGTIFNMAGDSLMVGFNVPFLQPDAAVRAWRAAMDMQSLFGPIAADWSVRYGITTGVGIGMCSGEVVIGNVGSPHYMSYTLIGNTINIAARLMQMAGSGEVLMSSELYTTIRDLVPANGNISRGQMALRGTSEPLEVYTIRL